MLRRPPRSTRTDTLFPYRTLFRAERGEIEDSFVGGERQHPLDAVELVLAAARAGLFEQRHACLDQRRQQRRQGGRTVSLVGVDADPRIRAARTYRTYARGIEIRITGELELQRARLREGGRMSGHHPRIVRADRERGQQGAHAIQAGELPTRHAAALRFEFTPPTVDSVLPPAPRPQP